MRDRYSHVIWYSILCYSTVHPLVLLEVARCINVHECVHCLLYVVGKILSM